MPHHCQSPARYVAHKRTPRWLVPHTTAHIGSPPTGLDGGVPPASDLAAVNTFDPEGGPGPQESNPASSSLAAPLPTQQKTPSAGPPTHIGEGLPPVPARLAAKILRRELVEMHELLPEFWQDHKEGGKAGDRAKAKKRALDLNMWLQCYAVYVGVLGPKYPHEVPELMAYMISIIRASQEFEGSAWAAYDAAYRRQAVAQGKTVRTLFHYLDDFLIVAHPASNQCRDDLRRLLDVFHLRVPIAEDKLEGPTTSLSFLGIELDCDRMVLRLPQEKLSELHILLAQWRLWRYCHIGDLRSLVGKLQHASKVVRPGRTFLRRMFELLKGSRGHRPLIRLNAAFRHDLAWWHTFLEHWNGVSILESYWVGPPDHHLFTDAAGTMECGAWSGSHWFQYLWPPIFAGRSITVKELLPIVLACIVWGHI